MIAQNMLDFAHKSGAVQASVDITEDYGFSAQVRLGQLETSESSREKSASVTIYNSGRKGFAETSNFELDAIRQTVLKAKDIANFTKPDKFSGLPDKKDLEFRPRNDLQLYYPWNITIKDAINIAARCEDSALKTDKHIKNSEGAAITIHHSNFFSANSLGFEGGYKQSRHTISIAPIAARNGEMERDYWYSSDRNYDKLASPEDIGRHAAQRALSRIGSQRISTCKSPVLFDAPIAASLLGSFVQAISGSSLYKNLTFLDKSLGTKVFPESICIDENPFLTGEMGSAPFDDEGVKVRPRLVVENGVVNGYFLSSYSARRLNMESTGNAGGSHNLRIFDKNNVDKRTLTEMLRLMGNGLFVTELMGQGINMITGDYSRGASGFWIQNGKIAFPVYEITIAGNLLEMFQNLVAIGNDEYRKGAKTTGSILIEIMTIGGK